MLQQFKTKTTKQKATQPKTQRGKGIVPGNPRRCLMCGKPIRENEEWVKLTSPSDPVLGAYSVIVHERCNWTAR